MSNLADRPRADDPETEIELHQENTQASLPAMTPFAARPAAR